MFAHQQSFHGVADAWILHLRVEGDLFSHLEVRRAVHIDVAVAVQVPDDRYLRVLDHRSHEALAAPRNQAVHILLHRHQLARGFPVGRLDYLNRPFGHAGGRDRFLDDLRYRQVRVDRLRAAAQHDRVSGLEAQRRRIRGDVRARLINDPDHADRHSHLAHFHAIRPQITLDRFTNRVPQRGDLPHAVRHLGDLLVIQRQPLQHRPGDAVRFRGLEVDAVGFEDSGLVRLERVRHR